MAFIVADKPSTPSMEPGSYVGALAAVIDLGTQPNNIDPKKPQHQVAFIWEIASERLTIDGKDMPRNLSQLFTLSLGEKANLRKALEAWRGKGFTKEELASFDLAKLLGVHALLNVIHNEKGKVKIAGVSGVPKGMAKPPLEVAPYLFQLSEWSGGELPKQIPEFIVRKIQDSPEYKKAVAKGQQADPGGNTGSTTGDEPF